jgi:hypothetical protein
MAALSFLGIHPDDFIGAERPPLNFQQDSGLCRGDVGYEVPSARRQGIWDAVHEDEASLLDLIGAEPTSSNSVEICKDETTPWCASGVIAKWRADSPTEALRLGENASIVPSGQGRHSKGTPDRFRGS